MIADSLFMAKEIPTSTLFTVRRAINELTDKISTFTAMFFNQVSQSLLGKRCAWYQKNTPLLNTLEKLATLSTENLVNDWSNVKVTLLQGINFYSERKTLRLQGDIRKIISKIPPQELDEIISEAINKGLKKENLKISQTCLFFITKEKFDEILSWKSGKTTTVKDLAETLGKYLPNSQESTIKESFVRELKKSFSFVVNFVPNLINTFLIAFSLFDIGKDPQSAWEANAMLDVYYKFIMIPTAIVVAVRIIFPILNWEVYLVAAGIVLVGLAGLLIYIKWLRPCPTTLSHCQNLTQEANIGQLSPVIGRDKEIQKLSSLFNSTNDSAARHAILVGPSGVGKTEIIRGLAQKIASGDVPKPLLNKKIFVINTASLIQGGMYGYADQLSFVLNRIKGYEKEVILVFEEVHSALKNKSCLSDFMKPILDRGSIHCIAITTEKEYDTYIKGTDTKNGDEAFERRFERIDVKEMPIEDTKLVLKEHLRRNSRGIIVEDEALDEIIALTNKHYKQRSQPAKALEVLTTAINQVATQYEQDLTPPILSKKNSEVEALKKKLIENGTNLQIYNSEGQKILNEINKLENEIKEIETLANNRKKYLRKFKEYLKKYRLYQEKLKPTALLATKLKNKGRKESSQIELFIEIQYMIPQIEKLIAETEKKLANSMICGVSSTLRVNKQLIQSLVKEPPKTGIPKYFAKK